jgi:hypothetical protein
MRKRLFAIALCPIAVLALGLLAGGAAGGNGNDQGHHGNDQGHHGGHGSTANGQTGYHFVVLDASGATDRLIIQGDGSFNANRAHGGGTFDHFQASGSPPLPLVSTGTWKADDVVSFNALSPTHGVYEGGTLVMHATFFPQGKAPIPNVMIEVDCNLGPAGVSTGKPEGVVVTFPGTPPVVYAPTSPTTGVTIFTLAQSEGNDNSQGNGD